MCVYIHVYAPKHTNMQSVTIRLPPEPPQTPHGLKERAVTAGPLKQTAPPRPASDIGEAKGLTPRS